MNNGDTEQLQNKKTNGNMHRNGQFDYNCYIPDMQSVDNLNKKNIKLNLDLWSNYLII